MDRQMDEAAEILPPQLALCLPTFQPEYTELSTQCNRQGHFRFALKRALLRSKGAGTARE